MKAAAHREAAALPAAERRTSNVERRTWNGDACGVRYDLEERLLEYAARIIRLVDALLPTRAANHVGAQLLRSGTSPLPNHGEAQAAESRNDFVHKLKICLKELRESHRWLRLIKRVPLIAKPTKVDALLEETDELIRIFVASLRKAGAIPETASSVREEAPEFDHSTFDVQRSKFDVQPPAGPVDYAKTPKPRRKPRPAR